ncbi:serine proteinase stubble-like isoform X2 [Venturia canescens]|uniref:serine proteinase stubble-like isoform X2 n=1 Tax=Venturia canescens TaxID=32260 RepID=UPI001C9D4540|nr:serine proteinase stubble-like isoform X2 [Venturia canescens]
MFVSTSFLNSVWRLSHSCWARLNLWALNVGGPDSSRSHYGTRMRWIGYVATILWWSGVVRSLTSLNRGYKISPKSCRVTGLSGRVNFGTCMFVLECMKSEGTHVGVCVDSFMIGSCCMHNKTTTSTGSLTTLQDTSLQVQTERVQSVQQYIQKTQLPDSKFGNAGGSTAKPSPSPPPSLFYVGGSSRPFQKRPQAKPSSEFTDYEALHQLQKHKQQKPFTLSSSGNNAWSKLPQDAPRPPPHRPPNVFDNFHTLKDKIDDPSVTTTSLRLPGKNQAPDLGDSLRTRPPTSSSSSSSWNNAHTLQAGPEEDSEAHETVYRPYLYNEPEEKSTSTYRPIIEHDARPNFVSRPEITKKPTKSRTTPKPEAPQHSHEAHTSTGGSSSAQTTHWKVTTEPAFVTKLSTTTMTGPTVTIPGVKNGAHLWSDHSWTPQLASSIKPHWTDVQDLLDNEPDRFQNRPSFEPTESLHSTEPEKPSIGSAHYITTDDLGTALTRPRPTRRRKPSLSGGSTAALGPDRLKNRPTSAMTLPTTTISTLAATSGSASTLPDNKPSTTTTTRATLSSTTTTTTTTTPAPTTTTPMTTVPTTTTASSTTRKTLGTVPIVSAVGENDKTECGVPPLFPRPETRIVGGKDASFGRWPWQVSVRRTSFFGFSSTHRCGGAVLNANWIATAGHCVDDLLTSQIRIRVGDYDFSSVQERLPYVERGIAKKVVHPKYNFFTYEYDLALVRLESALIFAPHISPICLPATDDLLIGENATVTGWGRLSEGGTLPSILQEVSVPIVSNDRCKTMFLRADRHEYIPEIFLCAGYETGGQDSCQGDSGGPLQVRGKDGRYFLAGIISWGIGCAEANLPGVCTRISKFVPWILKNVT